MSHSSKGSITGLSFSGVRQEQRSCTQRENRVSTGRKRGSCCESRILAFYPHQEAATLSHNVSISVPGIDLGDNTCLKPLQSGGAQSALLILQLRETKSKFHISDSCNLFFSMGWWRKPLLVHVWNHSSPAHSFQENLVFNFPQYLILSVTRKRLVLMVCH